MVQTSDKRFFDILRALAAICVVSAHSAAVPATEGPIYVFAQILDYVGTMGVPVFLLISGYLFTYNRRPFGAFWKRKLESIVVPWFFCATLVWLYIVLRKGNIGLLSWFSFVIGYGHSTYYLTVLVVLFLLFWKRTKPWFLYAAVLVSAFSLLVTAWVIDPVFKGELGRFYYLNPLHWAGFFAAGVLINHKGVLLKLRRRLASWPVLFLGLAASLAYGLICKIGGIPCKYFSRYALLGFMVNTILLVGMAARLENISGRWVEILVTIGKNSFPIYLLHQLFTGIVSALTNLVPLGVVVLLRPALVIGAVLCVLWIAKKVFRDSKILFLIGLRL